MSTTSQHLGLKIPDGSDPFLRTDFVQNYTTLDSYPGVFICTSTTRPSWGSSQNGMMILETDTRRNLVWNGTTWREMLTSPAVWYGSLRINTWLNHGTTLSNTVGTFTVNRPGSLITFATTELEFPIAGNAACNVRCVIDGVDSNWDGSSYGEFARTNFSGTPNPSVNWTNTMTSMGFRNVSSGSHSIGIHTLANSGGTTSLGVISCRMMAIFVNGYDT